jgi:Ca2+-binding RTX toxin-like protein
MAARKWGNERTIGDFDALGGGNNKDWDVAALDGGGYVVTWLDRTTPLVTARGQRYDAAGNPVGTVFEIGAAQIAFNKSDIVVTGVDGGGFVVAFTYGAGAGDTYFSQYDASGTIQFQSIVDSDPVAEGNQAIARTSNGFIMVQTDQFENGVDTDGITITKADLNNTAIFLHVLVNSDATVGLQTDPSVTELTDGKIVVSWVDYGDNTIKFRVFDGAGNFLTASIVVDDDPFVSGVPEVPPQVVGLANGNFLIVWHESLEPDSGDQSGYAVRGMIHNAAGIAQSGVLLINTLRPGDQTTPDIVALPDGGFFASWTSLPSGINADIKGLQFDVGGIRVGAEITINTTSSGVDVEPHLTVLSDGRIVAVWADVATGILRSQIIDTRDGLVTGTANTETLYGNDVLNDEIDGLEGVDTLYGLGGADTIYGGEGGDQVFGGRGDDTIYGGADADMLMGGLGADEIYGDGGNDTITFVQSRGGVTVNLATGLGYGAEAEGDSYFSIESVRGSNFGDILIAGDSAATLVGFDGVDTLTGGIGADTFNGGNGGDIINGGAGTDIAYYSSTSAAITLNLLTNVNTGGEAQGDNLTLVEQISGTSSGDTIIGNNLNNVFYGNGGNDRLGGGTGVDTLLGGAGSDTFVFAAGDTGQTAATLDQVFDYAKGVVGTGDKIDFTSALTVGGVVAAATATQASINAATGVASFFAGSGTTMADALSDIATSMTTGGNAVGEFALFRVNNAGNFYQFISDGVAGVGVNDVLVQLSGVTTVATIDLAGGDLTILT